MPLNDTNYTSWSEVDATLQSAIRYNDANMKEILWNRERRKDDRRTPREMVICKFRAKNSIIETLS